MSKPTIAMLWIEGPLSFVEQLCIQSFLDIGHRVVLYHYGPLENVPDGVELADANEILPSTTFLTHGRTGSPAVHADKFRYRMLSKSTNTIWADTDAYCLRPFESIDGRFYGWESDTLINNGVLGLPADSDALTRLIAFTSDEYSIPTWYGEEYTAKLQAAKHAGQPIGAGEQPWGVWGPHALSHFLHTTGESKYALPREALYPFSFKERRLILRRNLDASPYITENTLSIHLYGRRIRSRLAAHEGGTPHPQSIMGQLLVKHGIDPDKAPVPVKRPQKSSSGTTDPARPILPVARHGRGHMNLTDLANRHHSDRGSHKHRYTELYQMLFLPYRDKKISFLELGPQVDSTEQEQQGNHQMENAPSMRIWLQFFLQAEIYGLDDSDLSWIKHPRFTSRQCDMESQESIQTAAHDMGTQFDIIIDDASHASHHQQNAFLALFNKVKPGGMYIIEDLRWQPKAIEKADAIKTAALFQNYQQTGIFSHSDPNVAAAFNDLRIDFSGCFLFQAHFNKHRNDQVLVVHKR